MEQTNNVVDEEPEPPKRCELSSRASWSILVESNNEEHSIHALLVNGSTGLLEAELIPLLK